MLLVLPFIAKAEQQPFKIQPEYNLDVSFDISSSRITGIARMNVQAGRELLMNTGHLSIIEASIDHQKIDVNSRNGILKILPPQDGILSMRYEGIFRRDTTPDDKNYGVVQSVIGEKGISLTGIWYPQPDRLCTYRLKATLPAGYTAVSEAEEILKTASNGRTEFIFKFPHPADGINFIATDRYEAIKDNLNDIEIYAYFFLEDAELAKKYIEYTKKYLKLYENLIGRYPYKRFSIVENFLPTGYSMPAYTLLGQDVVRLPFIVETSLGHEILHQWFGNLVYIDHERGNWAEGLTTYLSDHLYEDQKGRGWAYRKQILADYDSYVNSKNEFPLKDFRGRVDFSSKAIGYGKAAMVFHMLRTVVGDDGFYKSLKDLIDAKRFQKASWDDIKKAFEKNSKKDLGWFFKQWIEGAGMPELYFEAFNARQSSDKFEATFTIGQKSRVYTVDVPLTIYYPDGRKNKVSAQIDKVKNPLKLLLDGLPEKIVIDEDYDIARKLSGDERAPVIARIIGDERPLIALPVTQKEFYKSFIDAFKEKGALERESREISDAEIKSSSLIIIGNDNPLSGRLFGRVANEAGFSIIVKENPWNPQKVIGIVNGRSKEEVDASFGKIFHYGKYSALSFDRGRNVYKKIEESQRGIIMEQKEQTTAIDVSAIKTLSDVIDSVSGKKIVYVGEYHDRFSNHLVQLQVIKGLYKKDKKIAVGMEMFQRPFQKTLDDYIAGRIDEKEFLKKSEYFKRWSFDYNLYKPILLFARAEKIPVVALNIQREIIDKVSKGGIDSLSEEEKKEIPLHMDFSDNEYRERLKDVFQRHNGSNEKNFIFFYQSQILWDETMAQSVDDFFKKNPEYQKGGQMVVLAGGGHLAYGTGIPKRTFRRNGYDYAILLNDVDVEKDIANYIIFPKQIDGITAPKLMVSLKEDKGKVSIAAFPEESVSEKAGLKVDDIIVSLDNIPVQTIDDVRIHLLYKKKGDAVRVKVVRKRFLLGDKEKEFDVILSGSLPF